jgi:hypothetical protein
MPQNFQSLGPSEASAQAGLWAESLRGGEVKLELRSLMAGAACSAPICRPGLRFSVSGHQTLAKTEVLGGQPSAIVLNTVKSIGSGIAWETQF